MPEPGKLQPMSPDSLGSVLFQVSGSKGDSHSSLTCVQFILCDCHNFSWAKLQASLMIGMIKFPMEVHLILRIMIH